MNSSKTHEEKIDIEDIIYNHFYNFLWGIPALIFIILLFLLKKSLLFSLIAFIISVFISFLIMIGIFLLFMRNKPVC